MQNVSFLRTICLLLASWRDGRAKALNFGGNLRKHQQQDLADNTLPHESPKPRRHLSETSLQQVLSEELTRDKEPLIHILTNGGDKTLSAEAIRSLPTWTQVSNLYGSEPIIYGLDTCQAYQERLLQFNASKIVSEPKPRVAGLFNTGTNAVAQSMSINYRSVLDFKEYNLNWGKHVPPRQQYIAHYDLDGIEMQLPVVLVRDPMYWMQSMCKAEYNAVWEKGLGSRCPNLVPNENERTALDLGNASTFPVDVIVRSQYRDHYESLASLWSEWNRLWLNYSRPRLMIRFEDFLFHGEAIMRRISQCAGINMQQKFRYRLEASKRHGQSSDMFGAIVKYGSGQGRIVNFTEAEKDYLRTALDPELMTLFRYRSLEDDQYAGYR